MATLARRLGTADAVLIGLGAMWGAGIFAAMGPAAVAAGGGLAWAFLLAAFLAFANATSSAQLAARYPTSGGTYAYGRAELGPWWGYLAGWCFLVGKTASCAAMALTASAYLTGGGVWERPVAIAIVVALVAINYCGVTKTALASRIIVAVVALVLLLVIVTGVTQQTSAVAPVWGWSTSPWGVLSAAGFLFFAFAGYARIATLGEEVRAPRSTIPRAILLALGLSLLTYIGVAVALLSVASPAEIASTSMPLTLVAERHGWYWLDVVIRAGAAIAAIGSLLALIAGVGRTSFAMAREGDLPTFLAAVHPRFQVPHRAELVQGLIVVVLIALVDLRGAIGLSSFGVLLYYAVANASALRQREGRMFGRWLQVAGLVGCLLVAATLPWTSVLGGLVIIAAGVVLRLVRPARRPS